MFECVDVRSSVKVSDDRVRDVDAINGKVEVGTVFTCIFDASEGCQRRRVFQLCDGLDGCLRYGAFVLASVCFT
jgi:hypothetical protein